MFGLFWHLFLAVALQCSDPGVPANGGRDRASGTVGDVVTYICNFGYNLRGSSTRTCQASGSWSDSMPSCERKTVQLVLLGLCVFIVRHYTVLGDDGKGIL